MNRELDKVKTKCCNAKIVSKKLADVDVSQELYIYLCSKCGKEISRFHTEPLKL